MEYESRTKVIEPRLMPHNITDACISATVGLSQVVILFGSPAGIAYYCTHSPWAALLAFLAAYAVYSAFTVRRISLSDRGITFHRWLGTPRIIAWHQISAINVARRSELIIHGWLWPIFPSRDMSLSLTCDRHYRIAWDSGYCFYPPLDPECFEQQIALALNKHA